MTNEEFAAKRYLTELQYLDKHIQSNLRELERLRLLSTSFGIGEYKEKVKSGGKVESRLENQVVEIVDLESDIKREIREYAKMRKEMKKAISLQEDENERLLLTLRYIENLTWEEISEKMDCSTRHVYRLHKIALQNFKMVIC